LTFKSRPAYILWPYYKGEKMDLNKFKIGFIGAGNMGGAMIGALVKSDVHPSNIIVTDKLVAAAKRLEKSYGIRIASSNADIIRQSDIVVFAVKPQVLDDVLKGLVSVGVFENLNEKKIIISIAAGIPLSRIEGALYPALPESDRANLTIVRVMPNTPALVGAAMSAMCANASVKTEDMALVKKILSTMGDVIICPESQMDAVTAVSGSGPAYCFYLAEAMIRAAMDLGFSREDAHRLTLSTLAGSVRLMAHDMTDPESLRSKVTSPGGTTEAAIGVLEHNDVKNSIISAIKAASKRSQQLSKPE